MKPCTDFGDAFAEAQKELKKSDEGKPVPETPVTPVTPSTPDAPGKEPGDPKNPPPQQGAGEEGRPPDMIGEEPAFTMPEEPDVRPICDLVGGPGPGVGNPAAQPNAPDVGSPGPGGGGVAGDGCPAGGHKAPLLGDFGGFP